MNDSIVGLVFESRQQAIQACEKYERERGGRALYQDAKGRNGRALKLICRPRKPRSASQKKSEEAAAAATTTTTAVPGNEDGNMVDEQRQHQQHSEDNSSITGQKRGIDDHQMDIQDQQQQNNTNNNHNHNNNHNGNNENDDTDTRASKRMCIMGSDTSNIMNNDNNDETILNNNMIQPRSTTTTTTSTMLDISHGLTISPLGTNQDKNNTNNSGTSDDEHSNNNNNNDNNDSNNPVCPVFYRIVHGKKGWKIKNAVVDHSEQCLSIPGVKARQAISLNPVKQAAMDCGKSNTLLKNALASCMGVSLSTCQVSRLKRKVFETEFKDMDNAHRKMHSYFVDLVKYNPLSFCVLSVLNGEEIFTREYYAEQQSHLLPSIDNNNNNNSINNSINNINDLPTLAVKINHVNGRISPAESFFHSCIVVAPWANLLLQLEANFPVYSIEEVAISVASGGGNYNYDNNSGVTSYQVSLVTRISRNKHVPLVTSVYPAVDHQTMVQFMSLVDQQLPKIRECNASVFVCDKGSAAEYAAGVVFGESVLVQWCQRHFEALLEQNFHLSKEEMDGVVAAAKSLNEENFHRNLMGIQNTKPDAWGMLVDEENAVHWSRVHAGKRGKRLRYMKNAAGSCCCENNINNTQQQEEAGGRHFCALSVLHQWLLKSCDIFRNLLQELALETDAILSCGLRHLQNQDLLRINFFSQLSPSDFGCALVESPDQQFVVSLHETKKACSCGLYQLLKKPCVHAWYCTLQWGKIEPREAFPLMYRRAVVDDALKKALMFVSVNVDTLPTTNDVVAPPRTAVVGKLKRCGTGNGSGSSGNVGESMVMPSPNNGQTVGLLQQPVVAATIEPAVVGDNSNNNNSNNVTLNNNSVEDMGTLESSSVVAAAGEAGRPFFILQKKRGTENSKERKCGRCGEPGHNARTCQKST